MPKTNTFEREKEKGTCDIHMDTSSLPSCHQTTPRTLLAPESRVVRRVAQSWHQEGSHGITRKAETSNDMNHYHLSNWHLQLLEVKASFSTSLYISLHCCLAPVWWRERPSPGGCRTEQVLYVCSSLRAVPGTVLLCCCAGMVPGKSSCWDCSY